MTRDRSDARGPGRSGDPGADDAKVELGAADTLASDGASSGGHSPPDSAAVAAASASSSPSSSSNSHIRGVGPGDRLGRYELGDELGTGGMASVFRAKDTELRRDVAVKVLFPHLAKKDEITRRFQREARAAAVLEHPNILRVYDVGASAGTPPFIVMELVRGQSLREVIEAHGAMLAELVACTGALLCEALAVAHAAGIVHRDVKPGNVMLADDGRLLLADFGVARLDDDDSLVTKSGALLGTPSFMAPEQALGNPVDARSDLYSVGASLYQLATGGVPFTGPTAKIVADASRGAATPALRRRPAVGVELSRFIERMMSPDPGKRPATAAAAAAELRAIAAAGGVGEPIDEVKAFALDRAGWDAAKRPIVVARLLELARAARETSMPQALAFVDRALALDGDNPAAKTLAEELMAPRPRRWLMVVVGVAAVGLAVGGVMMMMSDGDGGRGTGNGERGDAGRGTEIGMTGSDPDSDGGSGAGSEPDSGSAAAAAVDAAAAADAAGVAVLRRDAGLRPPIDAGATTMVAIDAGTVIVAADAAPMLVAVADATVAAPARVTFAFDTWCELTIDDEPRGRADREREVTLAPGRHRAECSQGPGLGSWSSTIEVDAGEVRRVDGTLLRPVEVTIEAGDSVRIAGKTIARGERVMLRPNRYRIEIIVDGKARAAAYVNIPRVASCSLRDRPTLDCYR